jgi:ribosomal protein S27E
MSYPGSVHRPSNNYPGNVVHLTTLPLIPLPPPTTVSCPYCTLLLTVPAGAPIIRCPGCQQTSAISFMKQLQMKCYRCHTLLSYMQNYTVIQCPHCQLTMAPPNPITPPPPISIQPAYTLPSGASGTPGQVHTAPTNTTTAAPPRAEYEGTYADMPPTLITTASSSVPAPSPYCASPSNVHTTNPPSKMSSEKPKSGSSKMTEEKAYEIPGDYSAISSSQIRLVESNPHPTTNNTTTNPSSTSSSSNTQKSSWKPFTRRSHDVSEEFTSIESAAPYRRLNDAHSIN